MRRLVPGLLPAVLLAAAACGAALGPPERAPRGAGPSRRGVTNVGLELAARLPRGADGCAIARPGALSSLRRSLYRRLSHGDPLAFVPDAPFVAVASAVRIYADRPRAQVALVRASADRRTVRRFLEERGGLTLDWTEGAPPRPGVVRARFVDDHTLELSEGRFPESSAGGLEVRCAELAALFPDAIEVALRRGQSVSRGALGAAADQVEFLAFSDEHRLRVERTTTAARADSPFAALVQGLVDGPGYGRMPSSVLAEAIDRSEEGRTTRYVVRFRWEDLALAQDDESRIAAAVVMDRARREAQPAATFDVSDLDALRVQRELWRARAGGFGPASEEARRELRRLLERGIAAHPGAVDLRRDLFELLSRQLGDAAGAAVVAEAAIRDGVGDAAEFAQLRREALSLSSVADLAGALAADGVVPRRSAGQAAETLAAAVLDGADYAFAEAAWLAGRALVARAYRGRGRPVASTGVDLEALPDTLAILVEAIGVSGSLWMAVEGARPTWGIERFDRDRAPRVALDVGRDLLLGAASTGSPARLHALGESLGNALEPGPVVVSFFIVPFGGTAARPSAWGRLEGQLVDGGLVLERAAGPAAALPWERLRRYLIAPLVEARSRRFPPPTVTIETETRADADALAAQDDAHPGVRCVRDELALVCTPAADADSSVRDLVAAFAEQRLGGASAALLAGRPRR